MGLAGVGDDGLDIPSRAEIEQILNDPGVDRDTKRELALDYIDFISNKTPQQCGFADDKDKNGFRDHLKSLDHDWITESDIGDNDSADNIHAIQNSYKNAKEKHDQSSEQARQKYQQNVTDGKAVTDGIAARNSETDAGCANSKEIFEPGRTAFFPYELFHPYYLHAIQVAGGAPAVGIAELRRLYDEQNNMTFVDFNASADEMTKLGEAIASSAGDVAGKLQGSLGAWEGPAADQAREYQKDYDTKTAAVAEAMKAAGVNLRHVNGSVGKFCLQKVAWLQQYYTDKIGGVSAPDIDRIIRIADGSCSQNDIKHCIGYLSIDAKNAFNDDWGGIDQETVDEVIKPQAKLWLTDVFIKWFAKHIENFQLVCSNTRTAVDGAWKIYFDSLNNLSENPYTDVGKPKDTPQPPPKDTGGGGKSTGGGGDTGGGGTQMPPNVGPTPKPPEPVAPPTPPGATDPAVNPVTQQPLETNPDTGQPYPIDPKTGEAIKAGTTQPETLTVQQGDSKISMAEPSQDGKMEISVDDGTGHPQDYKLDFGDGKVQGLPDATPQAGPQDAATGGAIHHDAAKQDDTQGQTYRPGDDGKIHIEDGKLKITAERPEGPDGPTQVTVDDGSGHPAKYTLGDDGKPQPATAAETGTGDSAGGRHAVADTPRPPDQLPAQNTPQHDVTAGGTGGGVHAVQHNDDSAGQQAEPVGATASAGDSTSPQSLSNPLDGRSDGAADNGMGDAGNVDPSNSQGGGATGTSAPGLGSAPGGTDQHAAPAAAPGMMGGGMMGGMGGGAAGGGGGEDQQRNSSAYRVDGGLFDTGPATGNRISGSLDDDSVIGLR